MLQYLLCVTLMHCTLPQVGEARALEAELAAKTSFLVSDIRKVREQQYSGHLNVDFCEGPGGRGPVHDPCQGAAGRQGVRAAPQQETVRGVSSWSNMFWL